MIHVRRFQWLCLALSSLWLLGCAGEKEQKPEANLTTVEACCEPQPLKPPAPSAIPHAESAEEAARLMANAITQARLQDFWAQLPPVYQAEANALVQRFGGKMDPELWNRIFGTLQKLTMALAKQRDFILGTPLVKTWAEKQGLDLEQLQTEWNDIVTALDVIVRSDLSNQQRLASFDAGQFLAGPGNDVLKQIDKLTRLAGQPSPFDQFRETQLTTLSAGKDRTTIQLIRPGQEPREIDYVKVEGRWTPQTWADGWNQFVLTTGQRIDTINPERLAQTKSRIIPQLDRLDAMMDQFLAAKTQAEFDQVMQTQGPALLGMAMSALPQPEINPAVRPEPATKEMAYLKFDRELPQATVDALFLPLTKITADPEKSQVFPALESGKTVLEVAPVTDISAFVEKLRTVLADHKAGVIVEVSPEELTITIKTTESVQP